MSLKTNPALVPSTLPLKILQNNKKSVRNMYVQQSDTILKHVPKKKILSIPSMHTLPLKNIPEKKILLSMYVYGL